MKLLPLKHWAATGNSAYPATNAIVNGGGMALGHPIGATGARLTCTLMYEMRRRQLRYGLVTMCVGGGQGTAIIYERI